MRKYSLSKSIPSRYRSIKYSDESIDREFAEFCKKYGVTNDDFSKILLIKNQKGKEKDCLPNVEIDGASESCSGIFLVKMHHLDYGNYLLGHTDNGINDCVTDENCSFYVILEGPTESPLFNENGSIDYEKYSVIASAKAWLSELGHLVIENWEGDFDKRGFSHVSYALLKKFGELIAMENNILKTTVQTNCRIILPLSVYFPERKSSYNTSYSAETCKTREYLVYADTEKEAAIKKEILASIPENMADLKKSIEDNRLFLSTAYFKNNTGFLIEFFTKFPNKVSLTAEIVNIVMSQVSASKALVLSKEINIFESLDKYSLSFTADNYHLLKEYLLHNTSDKKELLEKAHTANVLDNATLLYILKLNSTAAFPLLEVMKSLGLLDKCLDLLRSGKKYDDGRLEAISSDLKRAEQIKLVSNEFIYKNLWDYLVYYCNKDAPTTKAFELWVDYATTNPALNNMPQQQRLHYIHYRVIRSLGSLLQILEQRELSDEEIISLLQETYDESHHKEVLQNLYHQQKYEEIQKRISLPVFKGTQSALQTITQEDVGKGNLLQHIDFLNSSYFTGDFIDKIIPHWVGTQNNDYLRLSTKYGMIYGILYAIATDFRFKQPEYKHGRVQTSIKEIKQRFISLHTVTQNALNLKNEKDLSTEKAKSTALICDLGYKFLMFLHKECTHKEEIRTFFDQFLANLDRIRQQITNDGYDEEIFELKYLKNSIVNFEEILQEIALGLKKQKFTNIIRSNRAVKELADSITALKDYGIVLQDLSDDEGKNKGGLVLTFVASLEERLLDFYGSDAVDNHTNLQKFQREFKTLLHSQDALMGKHRAAWKPILANILLALTGLGLVPLIVNIAYQAGQNKPYTINNYLFWAQTKSEQKIEIIDNLLTVLGN